MWILPKNHPLYSAFVPASLEDLKLELNMLYSNESELPLMRKSKPLSLKTFYAGWKKTYWMQHLSGRILKPSLTQNFVERYTVLLEDIHVSHSLMLEDSKEQKTQDTYGLTSKMESMQLDLFSVSLKTSPTTLILDTNKLKQTWKDLAIQLNKEYTQRKKLALLTSGSDYSSSLWTTPCADDTGDRKSKYAQGGSPLSYQVKLWTTPSQRDYKDTYGMETVRKDGTSRLDQLPRQVFQWDKESNSLPGKPPALNPEWVAQLMGTTLEKIFFVD